MSLIVVDVVVVGDVTSVGTLDDAFVRGAEKNETTTSIRIKGLLFCNMIFRFFVKILQSAVWKIFLLSVNYFHRKKPPVGKTFADTLVGLSRAKKHRSEMAAVRILTRGENDSSLIWSLNQKVNFSFS